MFVAPDLPPRQLSPRYSPTAKPQKRRGSVRLAYLSRIHPIKNLIFLLDLLADLSGDIVLDVYGPIDAPPEYVKSCRDLISALPNNIQVALHGGIDHENVVPTLVDHHFFVLPSQSENFGHVFIEAMSAGCPLVISDRTPWRDLQKQGIGWDIPLEDRARWTDVLSGCVEMGQADYVEMSDSARRFAEEWVTNDTVEVANREVFQSALSLKRTV